MAAAQFNSTHEITGDYLFILYLQSFRGRSVWTFHKD